MTVELPGVLTRAQIRATAEHIVSLQHSDGLIPWFTGHYGDPWNHVEAAMALTAAGLREPARRAYDWLAGSQSAEGSWPAETTGAVITSDRRDTNQAAYCAVGVWHEWLVTRDRAFIDALWPTVRAALDWVVAQQRPDGAVRWAGPADDDALLIGSSCIVLSLRCGLALADVVGESQPDWELAAAELAHAVLVHPDRFQREQEQARHSMHWYYPVLGSAVRGAAGRARLASRWDEFVVPGRGARCVWDHLWVTGAETCELAIALDAVGERKRAVALVRDVQFTRDPGGGYQTGWVFPEEVFWPGDLSSWTDGAMILAADVLSDSTPGSGLFRGDGLPPLAQITRCDHACLVASSGG